MCTILVDLCNLSTHALECTSARPEERGIQGTKDLNPKTPDDVCIWLKDQSNKYQKGSDLTLEELFEIASVAAEQWAVHAKAENIHVNSCPPSGPFCYAKRNENWLFEVYPKTMYFKTWDQYLETRQFKKLLDSMNTFGKFMDFCGREANYLADGYPHASVIHNCYALAQLCKKYASEHDDAIVSDML